MKPKPVVNSVKSSGDCNHVVTAENVCIGRRARRGRHWSSKWNVDLEGVISRSFAYTPVPGGVGPMTINTLIMQTLESCENQMVLD